MQEEINALYENRTWSLIPSTNKMNIVGSNWIFKVKINSDGAVDHYKARLVAHGFTQLHSFNYDETFRPMVKLGTIRLILTTALSQTT